MDEESKRRRELERIVLEKVGEVISAVKSATRVDQVICSLHSLAVLLFPLRASLVAGSVDDGFRDEVLNGKIPSASKRVEWWEAFYRGPAFPTVAQVLLLDVASDWLACFPFLAREQVYDVFFVNGLSTEVVQALVPCLQRRGNQGVACNAVQSNAERLLDLCLLENNGVLQIAKEFSFSDHSENISRMPPIVSRVAQIVASIPDKVGTRRLTSLSSHLFFKNIIIQLLKGVQEGGESRSNDQASNQRMNGALLFAGETFLRICRRGSTDVLIAEVLPRVVGHVRSLLSSSVDPARSTIFETDPKSEFWLNMIEAIKDPYVVERMSEQLLHQLASANVTDIEAYWTLWLLYSQIVKNQPLVRLMFADKFLLWKIFPVCCARWIIQFAVLECPSVGNSLTKGPDNRNLLGTVQHLVAVWSKKDFMQSVPMEQQAYVTAALGLCMELMSKDELDKSTDVMPSILQGVSSRLESPTDVVRKMASCIALVFSKIIDPKNPLYLEDSCIGEAIDWEFGLIKPDKGTSSSLCAKNTGETTKSLTISGSENNLNLRRDGTGKDTTEMKEKSSRHKVIDPDEIIDPAEFNVELTSEQDDDDDDSSENSDSSSDSLEPYDLADDDTDLKKRLSNVVDVLRALRKSDDADGVERALDVAEKLVRASPDELTHVAGDLVRTLVHVRCSDLAVEGEEESVEEKRQRALVALLVTCPFQSLDTVNKQLYSPNVDTSQRIMILDVMTEAAQELVGSKTMKAKHQSKPQISTISESQAWFLPSSVGPPGAGLWKEVSETGTPLNYSNRYERELPLKSGTIRKGKTRRWSVGSTNVQENHWEVSHNKFPVYAAAFMLPAMQGFDKKRHGVDLLGRDFIVLGKLVYMLGVCMRCINMHPEATALAPLLLDMLRTREISHHKEAYVRRAVLFAASCVLMSLHPSYVASALTEGNLELSKGLEWVREWALNIAESDSDRDCYVMAMSCLQLHAEMALQASRALESGQNTSKAKSIGIPPDLSRGIIKIPYANVEY